MKRFEKMFKGFLKHLNEVVNESDLVFELLDSRFPEKTRNIELERKIKQKKKKLIFIINKADLIRKKEAEEKKRELEKKAKTIFVSAKEKEGINLLRKEIGLAKKNKEKITIGIVGYPNMGKSTLINALSGKRKGKTKVSSKAGYTRGMQKIRIGEGIYLIDSPGIIPKKADEKELFLVNAKNPNQLKDIEGTAYKLMEELGKEKIKNYFEIKKELGEEELLEEIAIKKNFFLKKAEPDTMKAARHLLEEYQKNNLKK